MPVWVEIVGYAASAAIVVSLAMSSVVKLRIISLIGCVLFVIYGSIIGTWPVVVSNAIIAVINIYYLRRELTSRKDVGAVPVAGDAPFLHDFLAAHERDIRRFHPQFNGIGQGSRVWLLTRDGLPAGVLAGRAAGVSGDELQVDLDYVIPAYRDSRLGSWLFGSARGGVLRAAGFTRVRASGASPKHQAYLVGIGFERDGDDLVKVLGDR